MVSTCSLADNNQSPIKDYARRAFYNINISPIIQVHVDGSKTTKDPTVLHHHNRKGGYVADGPFDRYSLQLRYKVWYKSFLSVVKWRVCLVSYQSNRMLFNITVERRWDCHPLNYLHNDMCSDKYLSGREIVSGWYCSV